MIYQQLRSLFLTLILSTFFVQLAQAQEAPPVTLETPYNTVYIHLYYLQPDSYEPDKAAEVIYGVTDSLKRRRLAIKLKQILDGKGLKVALSDIPNKADYTDTVKNQSTYTLFPNQLPEVYLERIEGKWYYSPQTVASIPDLHQSVYPFGADVLINLSGKVGQQQFLGLYVWQYFGFAIMFVLAFLLHAIFSRLLNPLVKRLSRSKLYPSLIPPKLVRSIARLLSVLIILQLIRIFVPILQLPISAAEVSVKVLHIATTIIIMLILLRILDIAILYSGKLTEKSESRLDDQLMPIVKRMVQVVVVFLAIVQIMRLLEVNVTALIAGVSIGGLALALAAQDTVKNLIGSTMIFIDKPFQIGDWIVGNEFSGAVEEVGFRTTRIKTIDSSIISVPNGTIANMSVKNLGVRVYRLMDAKIAITYDTPPDAIEAFIEGIKQIALNHPLTDKEVIYVFLTEMADSSINIMFRVPIMVNDYAEDLRIKEELYLAVIRLAETLGISFAFPSTSVYVESMPSANGGGAPAGSKKPEDFNAKIQEYIEGYKRKFD